MRHISVVLELFDVVYEAIELPLTLDFCFAAQAKSIEAFVAAYVGERGFDD